jgi:ribosomal protein L24E
VTGHGAPTVCSMCGDELEHCHGFVIEHDDGTVECSVACEADGTVHVERVPCADLLAAVCGCTA